MWKCYIDRTGWREIKKHKDEERMKDYKRDGRENAGRER